MTRPSDQHLMLGDVPDQVSPDVSGLVSGTARRDGVGDQLRLGSLAHPGWPYTGTTHEWRGFVDARLMTDSERASMESATAAIDDEAAAILSGRMPKAWPSFSVDDHETRYQKLDFGRLD